MSGAKTQAHPVPTAPASLSTADPIAHPPAVSKVPSVATLNRSDACKFGVLHTEIFSSELQQPQGNSQPNFNTDA